MATVYVIHAEADISFVKEQILPVLPSNGYGCWLARHHLVDGETEGQMLAEAMDQCEAILIIVSLKILRSPLALKEIETALSGRHTLIVVQIETVNELDRMRLPKRLWTLLTVDLALEKKAEADRQLIGLLPPAGGKPETMKPIKAQRVDWNEKIFSNSLALAANKHDHARVESLVEVIIDHLNHRSSDYPAQYAYADLQELRQEREFDLMRRYGEVLIASGTRQDRVRRLFAQALIETGQYELAIQVLQSIITDSGSSRSEIFEARGLVGRTFKQLYVNAPGTSGSAELLRRAIKAYETAYVEDQSNFWHGVNAASCILRAERDKIAVGSSGRAQEIAQQIVQDLDRRSLNNPLQVWDCASKMEALVAMGKFEEAEKVLDVYIHHPDMTAFEVSSTCRQFKQVLQLDENARGLRIISRLREAMERYRAGKVLAKTNSISIVRTESDDAGNRKPLIILLSQPTWEPKDIPDLTIQSRLGKIVTASGSDKSVRELLVDPIVISIEDSRPAGKIECDRSMPFIKATGPYTSSIGTYVETGDAALIAVIDDSIDVLHKAFLDANGNSRIVGIWDQTDTAGPAPDGYSYGTFHNTAAIDGFVKTEEAPPSLARNTQIHGTHVASIAAGRSAGDFSGGLAPNAKLLVIVSASSGPIGYSHSHIDALTFIDRFATTLPTPMPVVVNVSQGMNAGAHDGKSALEVAFDAFSESGRKPGRVVVKSAGNERDKGGHARVTLKTESLETLRWRRQPGANFSERIELWWSSADEIRLRLGEPVSPVDKPLKPDAPENWSSWVGTSALEAKGIFPKGGPFRLAYTKRHVDNGDSLLVIELGDATSPAGVGEWLLEIHGITIKERGDVHCWIERGEGGLPASFQYPHVSEDMTLSVPGTAQSVITVGAVDACKPLQVGDFSSYGPSRDGQNKPLVCAPGVNVRAAQAGTGDGVFLQSGTSMAAPHVAGAIALLLSRTAKAGKIISGNQIASALRQKTQNYNGDWDRGQGYGIIDVSALLLAFE